MDTITHGLVGMVGARAGIREHFGAPVGRLFVLSTVLPDIDALVRFSGPLNSLAYHRGITHSLFGTAAIALLFAAAARWRWSTASWLKLWGVFYLGLLSHIFLDLLTSFGTLLLTPFSSTRFSLDALFIIDLAFTGICVATILLAREKYGPARTVQRARIGALALVVYIAVAMVNHQIALQQTRASHPEGRILDVAVQPFYPTMFHWRGFVRKPKGYDVAPIFLLNRQRPTFEHIASDDASPLARAARALWQVKLYYWFARFPVMRVTSNGEGSEVTIIDLRFAGVAWRDPPFTMLIRFNPAGRAHEVLFGNHLYPVP